MLDKLNSSRRILEELLRRIRDRHAGYSELSIKPKSHLAQRIPAQYWDIVKSFVAFLKKFQCATQLMSGSTYPTAGMIVPVYFSLMEHVKTTMQQSTFFKSDDAKEFARHVKNKMEKYYSLILNNNNFIAAALDPRIKGNCLSECGCSINEQKQLLLDHYYNNYQQR